MKKHVTRGVSIVLLLMLIMFSSTICAKGTSQVPCRPVPEVCHPETESPPCPPLLCPDADTRETHQEPNR